MEKKLEIICIKTKDGVYATNNLDGYNSYNSSGLDGYIINDGKYEKTFLPQWIFVPGGIKKVQKKTPDSRDNYRYELQDKSFADKAPLVLTPEEAIFSDDDGDVYWREKYKHLSSLYEKKYDIVPGKIIDVDYELIIALKIEKINQHEGFTYEIPGDMWNKNPSPITEKNIKHCLLDKIMFPKIILSDKKCYLNSKETYQIIRQHVKNNLDPKAAEITSDYDFCFKVNKKIQYSEPIKYSIDVNNSIFSKRKRKSKWQTRFKTHRSVEVFEMTHAQSKYEKYSVIKGFEGKNQTDLKNKIDNYLNQLMEFLNTPLVDCPHCNGLGVKEEKSFDSNKRE